MSYNSNKSKKTGGALDTLAQLSTPPSKNAKITI